VLSDVNDTIDVFSHVIDCFRATQKRHTDLLQQINTRLLPPERPFPGTESADRVDQIEPGVPYHFRKNKLQRVLARQRGLYQEKACFSAKCCCACHDNISFSGRSWFLKVPMLSQIQNPCSRSSCGYAKKASLWISLTQIGIPWAVYARLEIMWNFQNAFISPSLSFERVVRHTSPGFKLLWELESGQKGNWPEARQELLDIFESGRASHRDIDPDGETWLEVSDVSAINDQVLIHTQKLLRYPWVRGNRDIQFALFFMLAEMGTQLNTPRLVGRLILTRGTI
jgi:hypothetical protein